MLHGVFEFRGGFTAGPAELAVLQRDADLLQSILSHLETFHGERVKHLVGDQHTLPGCFGRLVQPFHPVRQPRDLRLDALSLKPAQIGTALQHPVAARQTVRRQFFQQVGRQLAAAARWRSTHWS